METPPIYRDVLFHLFSFRLSERTALHVNRWVPAVDKTLFFSLVHVMLLNIQGGGGGQNFFATAGGKDPDGLQAAMDEMTQAVKNI